jgi:shikimate kinase
MARLLPDQPGLCIAPAFMESALPAPPFAPKRSIVLVGLMGAGKSTVGKRLARRLGLPFVDADEEIERAADHSITEIFDRFGEPAFRDGERRVIARLIEGPVKVIATGGGAFMNDETRVLILERCTAVWLDADVETLAARVGRRDTRPLLREREPRAVLEDLAARRNPVYAQAHLRVPTEPVPHERVVERILQALEARERE